MPTPLRLAAALVLAATGASPAADAQGMTTAALLDMPELFQISVIAGSVAMLQHVKSDREDPDCACFARWTVAEDVLALVSAHARRYPGTLADPFPGTMVDALLSRCRGAS